MPIPLVPIAAGILADLSLEELIGSFGEDAINEFLGDGGGADQLADDPAALEELEELGKLGLGAGTVKGIKDIKKKAGGDDIVKAMQNVIRASLQGRGDEEFIAQQISNFNLDDKVGNLLNQLSKEVRAEAVKKAEQASSVAQQAGKGSKADIATFEQLKDLDVKGTSKTAKASTTKLKKTLSSLGRLADDAGVSNKAKSVLTGIEDASGVFSEEGVKSARSSTRALPSDPDIIDVDPVQPKETGFDRLVKEGDEFLEGSGKKIKDTGESIASAAKAGPKNLGKASAGAFARGFNKFKGLPLAGKLGVGAVTGLAGLVGANALLPTGAPEGGEFDNLSDKELALLEAEEAAKANTVKVDPEEELRLQNRAKRAETNQRMNELLLKALED